MGTKISELTETGSAPTEAMFVIEYEDDNYKIAAGNLPGANGGGYDSGWSASTVAAADTVTLTHNLGRTDLTAQIWLSSSTETTKGDNPFQADLSWDLSNDPYGATITNLTTTQVTLQVGMNGINKLNSAGSDIGAGTCFYRIILTPAGGSGGGTTTSDMIIAGGLDIDYAVDYQSSYCTADSPWSDDFDTSNLKMRVFDSISGTGATDAGWGQAMSNLATLKATNKTYLEGDVIFIKDSSDLTAEHNGTMKVTVDWANDKIYGSATADRGYDYGYNTIIHETPLSAIMSFAANSDFAVVPKIGLDLTNKTITGLPIGLAWTNLDMPLMNWRIETE